MKALVQNGYGLLDEVLQFEDVDKPALKGDEVLVRVHAASIHVGDTFAVRGVPYLFRPMYGLRRPKARVPGTDMAGTVESVGADVTQLQPGEEVFGWGEGAFAEYMSTPASNLLSKPADLSFEQAAAIGVSACTALQALRDHGKVKAGQKVLVNGASGGVGTYAVQLAKSFGTEVTGVCGTRNVELVRSIGADHVVDYTTDDFTGGPRRYDLILDNVGNHSMSKTRRALTPGGT
ncbi:MAG: NAD(P)-dependent alcohol dehydrogenase, partial [Chloroflexota bacterium]|nr:NAD(P)-dependent alcohol dehydrogenase [Chloroflexota bacterium]